jgi:hypothetical protein
MIFSDSVITGLKRAETISRLEQFQSLGRDCYLVLQDEERPGETLSDNATSFLELLERLVTSAPLVYLGASSGDGDDESGDAVCLGLKIENPLDRSLSITVLKESMSLNVFASRAYPKESETPLHQCFFDWLIQFEKMLTFLKGFGRT